MLKVNKINKIERVRDEISRGMPIIYDGKLLLLTEYLTEDSLKFIKSISRYHRLVISKNRAKALISSVNLKSDISVKFNGDIKRALELSGAEFKIDTKISDYLEATEIESSSLDLAFIAERMPSVIISELTEKPEDLLEISSAEVEYYQENSVLDINYVIKAPVKLKDAHNTEIAVFRAFPTRAEHYAIIISNPEKQQAPLVRIHSSCYTGDLLGSRACDCGEQLDEAIIKMDKAGGGVILYLMQEGRGIGLANKLRAYDLKENHGMDTVEGNENLGFQDDARPFALAGKMLKEIGLSKVNLLTNNPRKIKGLEDAGIEVERSEHKIDAHKDIETYLHTKFTKLGHIE